MGESELDQLLNSLVDKSEGERDVLNKQVRFSISLSNMTSKRIDVVSRKVNLSKQEFIAKVVEASLTDLEERLGLVKEAKKGPFGETYREYDDEYQKLLFKELGLEHFFRAEYPATLEDDSDSE